MSDWNYNVVDQPRAGAMSRIATAVLVGIPMTVGLLLALGCYCAFELARFAIFPRPGEPPKASSESEGSFTDSLTNFARIHSQPVRIESVDEEVSIVPEQVHYH